MFKFLRCFIDNIQKGNIEKNIIIKNKEYVVEVFPSRSKKYIVGVLCDERYIIPFLEYEKERNIFSVSDGDSGGERYNRTIKDLKQIQDYDDTELLLLFGNKFTDDFIIGA